MKKLLMMAIVAMISLVANAQAFQVSKESRAAASGKLMAPAKAAPAGTDLWGYYFGGYTADVKGVGPQGLTAGRYHVAMKVPQRDFLKGAKIKAINVPGFADTQTNMTVWVAKTLNGTKLQETTFTGKYNAEGYNTVLLDQEVEITEGDIYVGYSFDLDLVTQYDSYPLAVIAGGIEGGLFFSQDGKNFTDISMNWNYTSAMQIYVSDLNKKDNDADIVNLTAYAAPINGKGSVTLDLLSYGNKGVKSVGYEITVNGVKKTGTATLAKAIASGLRKSGSVEIEYDAPAEVGAFSASVAIKEVNGEANMGNTKPVAFTVNTVTRVVPRMAIVEEYTGTGCGWCPRGWVGMEKVKNELAGKAAVIAWHKYNSTDPMYQSGYANIPFQGAPECTINRTSYPDPYYGDNDEGIVTSVEKTTHVVPTVDVNIASARFDETNTKISIKANTEFLTNVKGYSIAFAVTADNLSGTTSSWKQTNYYANYTATQIGDPELNIFGNGGTYGKSPVALVFNDVLIGSSYVSSVNKAPAFTSNQSAGSKEETNYELSLTLKTALKNALKYDKVYVTALIIDGNGQIANAARVRVLGADEPDPTPDPTPDVKADVKLSPYGGENSFMAESMSGSGKYVAGGNLQAYPVLWDTEKDELIKFTEADGGTFHAVNNDGLAVGESGFGDDAFACYGTPDGKLTMLAHAEGEAGGAAYGVTADGKTIVGYYFDAAWNTTPCYWNEARERIDLPLPTQAELGYGIMGGEARWISADGKVILGFVMDYMSAWPAVIWTKADDGSYTFKNISKDFWEDEFGMGKPYMMFTPGGISEDGNYIAIKAQSEYDGFDFTKPAPQIFAARYNVATGALETTNTVEGMDVEPSAIANDGTMVGGGCATGMEPSLFGRVGYVWPAGSKDAVVLDELLTSSDEIEEIGTNAPSFISADASYIGGFTMIGMEADIVSYILNYKGYVDAIPTINAEGNGIINSDSRIFNLQGQQLRDMNGHGLFIINGKKILK